MIGLGTLVNVATVVTGSSLGILFRRHLPQRVIKIVFQALGLFTIFIGLKMAFEAQRILIMVLSLVLGGITGEFLRVEESVENLSNKVKHKLKLKDEKFTEGFIGSFLLFCMGSMTFIGAIEEGMNGDSTLLLTKAVMDGFSSTALAAGLGIGVTFSALPLLIYQGGLTLLAAWLGKFADPAVITEISATGGIILVGLGFNILEIKKIKVLNLLPALLFVPLLLWIASFF